MCCSSPALNEDLAATAIWGSQQAELRGEGKYDGVFALWYGEGPGVDRSGDVMRHANMAGTSRFGGVLMAMGDDHGPDPRPCCTSPTGRWSTPICRCCRRPVCRRSWITVFTAMRWDALPGSGSA